MVLFQHHQLWSSLVQACLSWLSYIAASTDTNCSQLCWWPDHHTGTNRCTAKSYLVIKALCCIEQTLCQRLACRMYSCRHLRLLRDVFAIQSRRFICLDCAHKSSNKASCIHNTRRLANWYLLCTWTTLTYLFLHEPCSWHWADLPSCWFVHEKFASSLLCLPLIDRPFRSSLPAAQARCHISGIVPATGNVHC